MISLEKMIEVIESSDSIPEAAETLEITRQAIYDRLSKNGLMIKIKRPKLKVVKRWP